MIATGQSPQRFRDRAREIELEAAIGRFWNFIRSRLGRLMTDDEAEQVMQKLAQKIADDMLTTLCANGAFRSPRPTALRLNSLGAFEVIEVTEGTQHGS